MICLIAAIARNGVIGSAGKIPWHLPADLQRFKVLTMGHILIMGKKTHESIGRVLPGRLTVVVTRGYVEQCLVARSVAEAIGKAKAQPSTQIFICGGAEVYREALPLVDRMYLTQVHADFDGDVRFPKWNRSVFDLQDNEHRQDIDQNICFSFQTWNRR